MLSIRLNKGFAKIAQYLSIYIHYMVLKKGEKMKVNSQDDISHI